MYAAAVIGVIGALVLPGSGGWGRNWPFGLVAVAGTISYWLGGRGGGFSVLIGGRADERQALIRTRARARAGTTMYAAAALGAAVELALRDAHHRGSYWSAALVAVAGGVGCLIGLRRYGPNPGPGEDTQERAPAPEPTLTWWGANRQATKPARRANRFRTSRLHTSRLHTSRLRASRFRQAAMRFPGPRNDQPTHP
jgi:hypothetical protein